MTASVFAALNDDFARIVSTGTWGQGVMCACGGHACRGGDGDVVEDSDGSHAHNQDCNRTITTATATTTTSTTTNTTLTNTSPYE